MGIFLGFVLYFPYHSPYIYIYNYTIMHRYCQMNVLVVIDKQKNIFSKEYTFNYFYPNAISKTIIIINPKITPKLASILLSLNASGISSEQTTAIIAPAENVKR